MAAQAAVRSTQPAPVANARPQRLSGRQQPSRAGMKVGNTLDSSGQPLPSTPGWSRSRQPAPKNKLYAMPQRWFGVQQVSVLAGASLGNAGQRTLAQMPSVGRRVQID